MKRKYRYVWAAYTDNLCWGRMLITRGRNREQVNREAAASGKGAYIVRRERVYEPLPYETKPIYEYKIVRRQVGVGDARPLVSSCAAVRYLMENCYAPDDMWREKAYAVILDKRNGVLGHVLISTGGPDQTVIDNRLIAKCALDVFGTGVILSHNHPSGDPRPGANDIEMTRKLRDALAPIGLKLIDHIIVTPDNYFAFSEEKTEAMGEEIRRAS